MTERVCILIVGMHRSGTSAITRMLNLLGCDIAQSVVPADQFNERGYWEVPEIAELNDAILASVGSSWDDWRPIDPAWFASPDRARFDAAAGELLDRFFSGKRRFLIKDPRICRLLPFWRDAIERFGAEARVVLPLRPPVEVAASLLKRNGMNPSIAQLVWLRHVLDAEAASRDLPRAVVRYGSLLRNWREVACDIAERLGLDLPINSDMAAEIDTFFSPELRHHDASSEVTLTSAAPLEAPWFTTTWASLDSGAETSEAREALDLVRKEFDRATPTFDRPISELVAHGRRLKARLDDAEKTAEGLPHLQARLEERIRAEQEAIRQKSKELEKTKQELEEARQKGTAMHALFTEASRSLAQRNLELETLRHRLETIEASRSWRLTAPYRRIGGWPRQRLRALAPTPLGQHLIRWRNRLRRLLR